MKAMIPHNDLQALILGKAKIFADAMYARVGAELTAASKTIEDLKTFYADGKFDDADPTNNVFWTVTGLWIKDPDNPNTKTVFAYSYSIWYPPSKLNFGVMVFPDGRVYPENTSFFDPWIYGQANRMTERANDNVATHPLILIYKTV